MTFINEHKVLGRGGVNVANVSDKHELMTKPISVEQELVEIKQVLKKIEYHLMILSGADLTNDNF